MKRPDRGFVLLTVMLALSVIGALAYLMNREAGTGIELAREAVAADPARYAAEAGLAYATQNINALNCAAPASAYALSLANGTSAKVKVSRLSSTRVYLSSTGTSANATQTLTRTITPYATTQYQLVLSRSKPDAQTTVFDTFVARDGSSYNFGLDDRVIVDSTASGTATALLQFDLANSGLDPSAKVLQASMTLTPAPYTLSNGLQLLTSLSVRKLTLAWTEGKGQGISGSNPIVTTSSTQQGKATWTTATDSSNWSAAPTGQTSYGIGNVDLPIDSQVATVTTLTASGTPIVFDLTAPVVEWLANPASNFGVLLQADTSVQKLPFWSSEAATAANRPQLALVYQLPCGTSVGPVLQIAFGASSINTVGSTTLTYTLVNQNASAQSSAALTSALPSGLTVSGTPSTTCGGTASTSVSNGITTISLSGGTIPAAVGTTAGSCTVVATVTSALSGSYSVTSGPGDLSTNVGSNANLDGDTLTVTAAPPFAVAAFSQLNNPWLQQQGVITLQNPTASAAALTQPLPVNFPAGISAVGASTTCGGALTGTGSNGQMSGGTIPADVGTTPGTCTITATLAPIVPGAYTFSLPAGALQTSAGSSPTAAYALLAVPSADTAISNASGSSTWNWGRAPALPVYEKGGPYRALLQFDLSSIPSNTTIRQAKLRLSVGIGAPSGASVTLAAYLVSQLWVEGSGIGSPAPNGANWSYPDLSQSSKWTTNGAINLGNSTAIASTSLTSGGWVELDVTSAVQAWINGTPNAGLLLVNANSSNNVNTLSVQARESPTPPQLMVSY